MNSSRRGKLLTEALDLLGEDRDSLSCRDKRNGCENVENVDAEIALKKETDHVGTANESIELILYALVLVE